MKDGLLDTIEYRGFKIEIYADRDPQNPIKEWDMLGRFICFHRKYDLSNDDRFTCPNEVREYAKANKCRLYPLYLYDHSGITISMRPFHCPWDSGQVGWVMLEPEEVRKEYMVKRLTKKHWERVEKLIENEVKAFDDYLVGNVYGYIAYDIEGKEFDSCWGFFGDTEYMLEELKLMIDHEVDSFELESSAQEGAFV